MDKSTCKKITRAVPFLRTPEAKIARPYLAKPYQHALKILEMIEQDAPIDGTEIAAKLGLHRNTVYAIVGALKAGGYKITQISEGSSNKLIGENSDVF